MNLYITYKSYNPICGMYNPFIYTYLVFGLEHFFPEILGIIIPTDFHILQKGLKPPTSCIYTFIHIHDGYLVAIY